MADIVDRLQSPEVFINIGGMYSPVAHLAAAEITRLRAALATARREGMEEAAKRLEELHRNHKYNPQTGEGSEHDVGYYRALAEGAAHILRAAAKEGKP